MKKVTSWLTICLFFGFLFLFMALSIALPDEPISTVESRSLMQRPVNDLTDLPALTQNWTDYVVDQFPYREDLLKAYSALELAQGKYFTRNTYVADGDWLLTEVYRVTPARLERLTTALQQTAESLPIPLVYTILPQKNEALPELGARFLDRAVGEQNRAQLLDALQTVDLLTVDVTQQFLQTCDPEQRMQMYYKTDFHWNAYGAFLAADYIEDTMRAEGILAPCDEVDASDFLWEDFTGVHTYQGDLNRRFSNLFSTQEEIPYYTCRNAAALQYYLTADATEPVERTQIVGAGLSEPMLTYNSMFTENLGYFRVENPEAVTDQSVIILKDSYQNPTTDFFSHVFAQVHVIDPRSYAEPYTLAQLVERWNVDAVLLLYHQNNASEELITFLEME